MKQQFMNQISKHLALTFACWWLRSPEPSGIACDGVFSDHLEVIFAGILGRRAWYGGVHCDRHIAVGDTWWIVAQES